MSYHFSVHKTFERDKTFVYFFFLESVHFPDKIEIFFRSEIIDQEAIINESTGNAFPVFTLADINIIYNHFSIVCLQ